jgi:hypothetical protein
MAHTHSETDVRIVATTIDCLIDFILLQRKANVNAYEEEIAATRCHTMVTLIPIDAAPRMSLSGAR